MYIKIPNLSFNCSSLSLKKLRIKYNMLEHRSDIITLTEKKKSNM